MGKEKKKLSKGSISLSNRSSYLFSLYWYLYSEVLSKTLF